MGFKLVRVDATEQCKIPLAVGTHFIGRGKFLDCHDHRVSRNHGLLEVTDDTVHITALHKNPCFFRNKTSPNTNILSQNESIELSNGDQFGLVPDSYWYELIYCIESLVPPCPDHNPTPVKIEKSANDEPSVSGSSCNVSQVNDEPSVSGSSCNVSQVDIENTVRIQPSTVSQDTESTFMDTALQTDVPSTSPYKRPHSEDSPNKVIKKVRIEPQSPCVSPCENQAGTLHVEDENSESQAVNRNKTLQGNVMLCDANASNASESETETGTTLATVKTELFNPDIVKTEYCSQDIVKTKSCSQDTVTTEPYSQDAVNTDANNETLNEEPTNNNVKIEPNSQENVDPGPSNNQLMSWNPEQNTPPREFLDELMLDESDSGSELEDISDIEDDLDVQAMPLMTQSPRGTVYPLLPLRSASDSRPITPPACSPRPDSEVRDRSPLRSDSRSITPPPYSPLSSPRRNENLYVHFRQQDQQDPAEFEGQRARRGRGRAPARRSRRSGGNVGGRGRRAISMAVEEYSGWQRGERVIEVCLNDEDVPPRLREMVHELVTSRRRRVRRERRQNVRVNEDDSDSEDEFLDAESSVAQELFGGDREATKFDWSPMSTFSGRAEEFQEQNPGPVVQHSSAYEAFRTYWDDEILEHIVRETNRYASELKSSSESFSKSWYDTNIHEILILFSFWMMLGIIRMPSIKSCFSNSPLLKTNIFGILLTQSRYWDLNRALHFVDNSTRTPDSSKLFCLGPIAEHLNAKFQQAYIPGQNITIDESLTLWKGNLSFRQYIKTKAARYGIKTFELCESMTGYLWSFVIYTGKDVESPSLLQKSTEVVIGLVRPLLNKGHKLFLDNWFNSPILARFLKKNRTDCIGTLRKSRKDVPALIQLASLQEGTCVARHSGDVVVMAYQDKKTIYTISTCHGTESVQIAAKPSKPSHYKPAVIADYNMSMGGVDKKDQMLEPYLIERKKNRKWYKKLFKRLLNVSIFNSRILCEKSGSGESLVKQQAFRLKLVQEIMDAHLPNVPQARRCQQNRNPCLPNTRFLGGHHFVERSSVGDGPRTSNAKQSIGRRLCVWCRVHKNIKKKTVYTCEKCEVPLCLEGCFKEFHTIQ